MPTPSLLKSRRYGHQRAPQHVPLLRAAPSRREPRDNAIAGYLESIRQAEAFLATRGRTLLDADRSGLEAFMTALLTRRSASTVGTRCKGLRVLCAWLEEKEEVPSPMGHMRPPIVPEQPVPVISDDSLRRLLATYGGKDFDARRSGDRL